MTDPLAGLYQQLILDHSRRRVGEGEAEHAHASRYERNPTCGDEITSRLTLDDDGRIASVAWTGNGCSISMASASVLAELAPGATVDETRARIEHFREVLRSRGRLAADEELLGDAVAFEGVAQYVMRVKCAMLAWVALEGCLDDAIGAPARE